MNDVVITDYGVGNLLSAQRAFEAVGARPVLSADPDALRHADRLVLPGVGAFGSGMEELKARGLVEALRDFARSGRPFLGICLGMQLMLETSEEFGSHDGLGLVPGRVVAVPPAGADGRPHRIPHIGWNALRPAAGRSWEGSILAGLEPDAASVYFVHSFMAVPDDPAWRLADTDYDGIAVCAAVSRDALHGCQFHPEKSGPAGLRILANFMSL